MPLLSAAAAELSRRGLFAAPLGATLATTDPDSPVLHSEIAAPSGVAGLDASGVVPLAQLPEAVLTGSGERPVAKGELVYNVQDYGATGDGSTDDLPAIDAAIDAALATYEGVVYFPRGIYRIAGSIGRASGLASIAFRGAGELSTRIRSLTDAPVVTGAFSACRFDNLILDANGLGSPCISAHLDKTVLDSLQLYGWTDYGMRLNDGTFGDLGLLNRIQRCSIDQCTGTGIWTGYRMIDSWIVENNIGASYADLSIEGGPIRILGNHLDGSPQINIELRGNRRITIANNIMEGRAGSRSSTRCRRG
ncbi:glycosyl hydrolase family 28-related protein [Rathayibacter oskolensis]|uniref:glycosyl hydrolase family 28-related protein n=1 Tax=Rathayibacter oskolensis TaxID=1891671 RepID=UPI00265FB51B|nr:glycosyl hydrolase family 28-related protein [Rathayibacter oskolensis]WKK72866.1 glycosyl hydrolase family 28-related protein [Rathayibacter oskolensis]